ncbi:MAG: LysR family transcriptional regulator [Alphaproteobacteria bacterium]|nr:LysR family transcriptional regulator [Alphaproteobacteria bacterium SS10]
MDERLRNFDWNHARAFLATAETGSFSGAARRLGSTQPTIGRQVAALEEQLNVLLFDRVGKALNLTDSGLSLLEFVKTMNNAAEDLSLTASGRLQSLAGQVSITASDGFCAYIMPSLVRDLSAIAPDVEIEIVSSDQVQDLRRREADIAIRHVRPDQPELIARHIRQSMAYLYAASGYLDQHGRPSSIDQVRPDAAFIGFETSDIIRTVLNSMGMKLTPDQFKIITNNGVVGWELCKLGLGYGVMAEEIGDATDGMEAVLRDQIQIEINYWLVTHQELLRSPRIRLVYDFLAEQLKNWGRDHP